MHAVNINAPDYTMNFHQLDNAIEVDGWRTKQQRSDSKFAQICASRHATGVSPVCRRDCCCKRYSKTCQRIDDGHLGLKGQ
jgi:hypothetical protein